MSNRVSSNIKNSNNPEDRWDSSEVNKDIDKLDSNITKLSENLVTTNTVQTINGQKTFFTLFIDEDDTVVTYNKVMNDLPFEVSPVFGPATYQFGVNRAVEEGSYDKHNASGTTMDVAALNPSFMPSEVYIEVISDNTIYVKALNIPLPKTALAGSYSISSSNMDAYLWKTSVSIEDTLEVTNLTSSGTFARNHNIYVNYNPDTDIVSVDLTENSIQSENVLTRCIGSVFSLNSSLVNTKQNRGSIKFNEQFTYLNLFYAFNRFNLGASEAKCYKACILKGSVKGSMNLWKYDDGTILPYTFTENRKFDLPDSHVVYVPLYFEGRIFRNLNMSNFLVSEIIFGDLAL